MVVVRQRPSSRTALRPIARPTSSGGTPFLQKGAGARIPVGQRPGSSPPGFGRAGGATRTDGFGPGRPAARPGATWPREPRDHSAPSGNSLPGRALIREPRLQIPSLRPVAAEIAEQLDKLQEGVDGEPEEDPSDIATVLQEDSVLLHCADLALEPRSEKEHEDGEGGAPNMGSSILRLEDRIAESRLRRLATGRRLVPLLDGPDDEGVRAFAQACLEARAEFDLILEETAADLGSLEEASVEQQAIARDVADLQDNDVRLDALLQKMAKKLDGLTQTLGGA